MTVAEPKHGEDSVGVIIEGAPAAPEPLASLRDKPVQGGRTW